MTASWERAGVASHYLGVKDTPTHSLLLLILND
jgi:hypothetical protein